MEGGKRLQIREGGFTLVEILIMMVILSFVALGIAGLVGSGRTEAMRAILKWKFKPRVVDGVAVERRATQTIDFTLEGN